MNKMPVKRVVIPFVWSLCILSYSCSNDTDIVDVDNVETVELDDVTTDLRIVPVKCAFPMDEIHRVTAYDDYIFLFGMSGKNIYCIENDSVISTLDAIGRGRGEYSYINDFAYSPIEHMLYISADHKLMKYSVPEMEFIGSTDINVTSATMIVLSPDELLFNGSFFEDNKSDVYRGFFKVSAQTGKVVERCYDFDYESKTMLMSWDLTPMPGGFVFPRNSLTSNRIMFYNTETGNTDELFSFSFNSKWKVPKRLIRLAKKDPMIYALERYKETRHLEGGHFPCITDSALVFWCFPREGDDTRQVAVIVKDGKVACRSYMIPGMDFGFSPFFLHNGYCVDIVTTTSFDNASESDLSPLGSRLKRITDNQPFDNPVFVYFKVD